MAFEKLAEIYNYRQIDLSISTSGQPTAGQFRQIAAAGFGTVINLALPDDSPQTLPDERNIVEPLGLKYVHIPVPFEAPTENHLQAFFAALDEHEGTKVWIHCVANIRVLIFLGLYRAMRQKLSREQALEPLFAFWQPTGIWKDFIDASLGKNEHSGAYLLSSENHAEKDS